MELKSSKSFQRWASRWEGSRRQLSRFPHWDQTEFGHANDLMTPCQVAPAGIR